MKKNVVAMIVTAVLASAAMGSAMAEAQDVTVNGGTIYFKGTVVDAACSVVAGNDGDGQTVTLDQVRAAKLAAAGAYADQKQEFHIDLKDCDPSVSQNAAVIFNGQADAKEVTAMANTAGAGAATNVALQLFGPDGAKLAMGDESSAVVIDTATVRIPLSVDYVATAGAATPGDVAATATFKIHYS